ncbi:MAG TPA: sigma-70 family RNA polymerase sigma factor [Polyangia bacterium]|nr:sigma-70 family RNA polymerase sigma factor [Polyangia bacterium]
MKDKEARFAELLRVHGPGLGRVAASYARPADQDDLAQEISLAIWNALDGFRGEASERTFLYRIAHTRGLSHLARRRAAGAELSQIADGAPGPETRAVGREEVERLYAAIRDLPVPQRRVLTLALEGMSHAEIGACVGITAENAAVRLSRARAALRQRMEEP